MAEQAKKEDIKVFTVSSSPHLAEPTTSQRVMLEVAGGTLPAAAMAVYLFQWSAAGVLISCVAAALVTEWVFNAVRKRPHTITDGSALVTGLILALSLPPTMRWWMAVVGTVVAVGVGKMLFGGLGSNIFNPAMVGRAFLMACFGTMMTTWTLPAVQQAELEKQWQQARAAAATSATTPAAKAGATQPAQPEFAAVTGATPLALAKQCLKADAKLSQMAEDLVKMEEAGVAIVEQAEARVNYTAALQKQAERLKDLNASKRQMFMGNISGSLGETSALLWLVGGVFLLLRRTITYHIPLAVLGSAIAIAAIAWLANGEVYPNPLVHLSGGGLMMCAFFIATDPVSCPLSKLGRVIFGVGVGALIMLIRLRGGYPEGVMYAVLLMNSVTPLLDRWTRPRPLGGHVRAE